MNWVAIIGVVGVWLTVFLTRSQQAREGKRHALRQKAILLGVQWLIERAEQKPTSYVTDLIKEALKDPD
jgi:hypothetical protein